MKISKQYLKQIITEEINNFLHEQEPQQQGFRFNKKEYKAIQDFLSSKKITNENFNDLDTDFNNLANDIKALIEQKFNQYNNLFKQFNQNTEKQVIEDFNNTFSMLYSIKDNKGDLSQNFMSIYNNSKVNNFDKNSNGFKNFNTIVQSGALKSISGMANALIRSINSKKQQQPAQQQPAQQQPAQQQPAQK